MSLLPDLAGLFPGVAEGPYLDTATYCLGNTRSAAAMSDALSDWQAGAFDWRRGEDAADDCRALFAGLIGGSVDEVAVVGGASVAAGTVAAQFPVARPGQNVVVPGMEFTSNYFPWVLLGDRGYELRLVDGSDGALGVERFESLIDGGTVLVAASLVQSSTGYRVDVADLAKVAHEVGAKLVIDGSQALGAVDFDVVEGPDAVFSCDQKFLLGARGLGYLWVTRDWLGSFRPVAPGWRAGVEPTSSFYGPGIDLSETASRLEHAIGWFVALGNRESLAVLAEIGIDRIAAHVAGLVEDLRSQLEERDLAPLDSGPGIGPIVTVPLTDAHSVQIRLAQASIRAAVRAGRLRVSLHLYNTADDVDRLVAALK